MPDVTIHLTDDEEAAIRAAIIPCDREERHALGHLDAIPIIARIKQSLPPSAVRFPIELPPELFSWAASEGEPDPYSVGAEIGPYAANVLNIVLAFARQHYQAGARQ